MLLALGLSNACSSFGEAASVQDAGTGDGFSASKVVVLRSTLEAGAGQDGQDSAAGAPGGSTEGDSNGNSAHAASGLMAGGIKA